MILLEKEGRDDTVNIYRDDVYLPIQMRVEPGEGGDRLHIHYDRSLVPPGSKLSFTLGHSTRAARSKLIATSDDSGLIWQPTEPRWQRRKDYFLKAHLIGEDGTKTTSPSRRISLVRAEPQTQKPYGDVLAANYRRERVQENILLIAFVGGLLALFSWGAYDTARDLGIHPVGGFLLLFGGLAAFVVVSMLIHTIKSGDMPGIVKSVLVFLITLFFAVLVGLCGAALG